MGRRASSGRRGRTRRPVALGGAGALLVVAALVATFALSSQPAASSKPSCSGNCTKSSAARSVAAKPAPLSVAATVPAPSATAVASNTTITVEFSTTVRAQSASPTLSPAVAGTWTTSGRTMEFWPSAPLVPYVQYTLTVPGGAGGVVATDGTVLSTTDTVTFTVEPGSVLRLQQLLAQLGYLPLSYADPGPSPAPRDMALPQPGAFAWRWSTLPAALTSQWTPGVDNEITKAAVMSFETQNGLSVDGNPGPAVWTALLADATAGKANTLPISYVLVTKALPEHLTVWVNGALTFSHVPCNTGVPGATTTDGTFAVFEHVQVSNMKGTDVTGTTYNVTVPWASYFHGGDALHGYPRAAYGFPQSNGCVEMPIPTAGKVWPDTPIGTLVTVE